MKKLAILIAVAVMITIAIPAFSADQWELGLSWTPIPGEEQSAKAQDEGEMDSITGFHFGYIWWHIGYATWDALVMPPSIIEGMTGYQDDSGNWQPGYYRPGFLNLFDVGGRLNIGPFVGSAEVGINNIYVYQGEQPVDYKGDFGANLRLGVGLKFNWWGISVTGTSVFPSFRKMTHVIGGLFSSDNRDWALGEIQDGLVPSILLVLYL